MGGGWGESIQPKIGKFKLNYGKCPKISYTKVSDKISYANSADPDQTAPEGAVWSGSTLFAISTEYFKKQLHRKQKLG